MRLKKIKAKIQKKSVFKVLYQSMDEILNKNAFLGHDFFSKKNFLNGKRDVSRYYQWKRIRKNLNGSTTSYKIF